MKNNSKSARTPRPSRTLRLSGRDFSQWGLNKAAYILPATGVKSTSVLSGETPYMVYAADGRTLGVLESRDHAIAAIVSQGMQPFSVH